MFDCLETGYNLHKMENLTFLTYSLGCRTNRAEINQIAKELTEYGFIASERNPDVILVNTCVVTAKAERETRKVIRRFRRLYSRSFLVVLGCGVDAKQKLKISLPKANFFVENLKKQDTAKLIAKYFHLSKTRQFSFRDKYFLSGRALLKIQEGCDHFCSYCIVPFLRGKPKSFLSKVIISQIKHLEKQGIREIILTGTNLALYGKDLNPETNLAKLLKKILKETKIERITLSSIEPDLVNKKFVKLFLTNQRLSPYFHLALQSGSPPVLQRMGRKTNLKKLLDFLLFTKERVPEFTFRADILVGFPGETEKEFKETIDFIKKAKISFAHIFPYSLRPRTGASFWIERGVLEDLPKGVKKQRVKILQSVVEKIRLQEGKKLIGKTLPCLFIQKENQFWQAIASNSWSVKICTQKKNLRGEIRKIKVAGAEKDFLVGRLSRQAANCTLRGGPDVSLLDRTN